MEAQRVRHVIGCHVDPADLHLRRNLVNQTEIRQRGGANITLRKVIAHRTADLRRGRAALAKLQARRRRLNQANLAVRHRQNGPAEGRRRRRQIVLYLIANIENRIGKRNRDSMQRTGQPLAHQDTCGGPCDRTRGRVVGSAVTRAVETRPDGQRVRHNQRRQVKRPTASVGHTNFDLVHRGQVKHPAGDKALIGARTGRRQSGNGEQIGDIRWGVAAGNLSAEQRDRVVGRTTGSKTHPQFEGSRITRRDGVRKHPACRVRTREIAGGDGGTNANHQNIAHLPRQLGRDDTGNHHILAI